MLADSQARILRSLVDGADGVRRYYANPVSQSNLDVRIMRQDVPRRKWCDRWPIVT
jgi:hypothetical protein